MRKIMLAIASATISTALVVAPSSGALSSTESPPKASNRPNIVVIMADDQDDASLKVMPHLKRLLIDKGVTFTKETAVFPLCCPVRAAYLSGQVGHNNSVRGNTPPEGGYENLDASKTFPVWLSDAGYATTHLGKYPNGYDGSQHPDTNGVPPGWTEWHGAVDPTTYLFYDYVLNENGTNVHHGRSEDDYQTDVLTDLAVDFIDRRANEDQPFFLDVAYLAPHWEFRPGTSGKVDVGNLEGANSPESSFGSPPVPAPRHIGMFEDATAPRRPSFNEEDVSDKPTFVRNSAPLTQAQIDEIDIWYRARLEALQAVDEGVERIIQTLKAAGELDNTYIIYTADNGWLQGEHRISLQKVHAYNESSRVPLIVRAPGGEAGGRVAEPTSSLDLTQTILDLAGARPEEGYELDGMSLAPYFSDPDLRLGRAVFVETAAGNEGYVAVTAGRWKYVEYNNGDRELYDLRNDRFEMNSLHEDPTKADLIAELSDLIGRFRTCNGSDCVMTGISTDAGGS